MKGVNKAIIVGTLGQDPDVKYLTNGDPVVNISVATNESWKDKATGEPVEKTEWHRIVVFGKLAQICADYLKKGSQVYFEGSLQTRKWQDQSGADRYSTEIKANEMQMLGGKNDGGGDRPSSSAPSQPVQSQRPMASHQSQAAPAQQAPVDDGFDDIPF